MHVFIVTSGEIDRGESIRHVVSPDKEHLAHELAKALVLHMESYGPPGSAVEVPIAEAIGMGVVRQWMREGDLVTIRKFTVE